MALITLEEAAARVDAKLEKIAEWIALGMLAVQVRVVQPAQVPPGVLALLRTEQCVEEDELFAVAESEGWLELSAENWDDEEDE